MGYFRKRCDNPRIYLKGLRKTVKTLNTIASPRTEIQTQDIPHRKKCTNHWKAALCPKEIAEKPRFIWYFGYFPSLTKKKPQPVQKRMSFRKFLDGGQRPKHASYLLDLHSVVVPEESEPFQAK
jgi:hypothetical protein